jgi:hypothetical protein
MGIVKQAEQIMIKMPEFKHMFAAGGFGFSGTRARIRASLRAAEGFRGTAWSGAPPRKRWSA